MNEALVVIVRGVIAFFTMLIFSRALGKQQIPWVQFSVERDDLNMLDMIIYRIKAQSTPGIRDWRCCILRSFATNGIISADKHSHDENRRSGFRLFWGQERCKISHLYQMFLTHGAKG